MHSKFLQSSLLAIALSLTIGQAHSESPEFIALPDGINQQIERFPLVDPANLPFSAEPRKDYAITLGGGKGVLISPNWVMTASHVIGWDKQKHPWKLSMRFQGRNGKQYRAKKVFRNGHKDIALVQLQTPILEGRQPVILMRDLIKKGRKVNIKKVSEGYNRVWKDIPARGNKHKSLYVSKKQRKGGAGTSGSPWLIETPLLGDVLVGITHGSGRAPQVAFVKNWIEKTVSENTPGEVLYWASKEQVFAQAVEDNIVVDEVVPKQSSTLIVLP